MSPLELMHSMGDGGAHTIAVDSGMLAFVDATTVDSFLDDVQPWCDGTQHLPDGHWVRTDHGILVDTGGDDLFPFEADLRGDHIDEFVVTLDTSPASGEWTSLGRLHVPSRLLLVSDPAMAEQFVLDEFDGPISAPTVWTVMRLPSAQVDVDIQRDASNPADGYPLALRCRSVIQH